jgi:ssDNA-binding Zn-finger/Zn-ribbon topoisomerase 1
MTDLIPTGQIPEAACPRCGNGLRVITKLAFNEYTRHKQFVGCMSWPLCGYVSVLTDEIKTAMEAVQVEREMTAAEF